MLHVMHEVLHFYLFCNENYKLIAISFSVHLGVNDKELIPSIYRMGCSVFSRLQDLTIKKCNKDLMIFYLKTRKQWRCTNVRK